MDILDRIDALCKRRGITRRQMEKEAAESRSFDELIPKVERLLEVYDSVEDAKTKNEMLKEVLSRVDYLKTVNGRWHNNPSDFTLLLYPRVPGAEGYIYRNFIAE